MTDRQSRDGNAIADGSEIRATYRLQLRGEMTFERAATLVPHLAELGISHLYASPIFEAVPGSTHGYDVIDPNTLDPVLGGATGFSQLSAALQKSGIGLIVDFVPNHMAAHPAGAWFKDVLTWGSASRYADHFDIDWSAPMLVLPLLAEQYGDALTDGKFGLVLEEAEPGFAFTYGGLRLPISPTSYSSILERTATDELRTLGTRFAEATPSEIPSLRRTLAKAIGDPVLSRALGQAVQDVSRDRDALHVLHEVQAWRLIYWRAGRDCLTYRRFFEISDLIGLAVERQNVFDDVHRRLLELIGAGRIQGLRLDHIDGLADPASYLDRLNGAVIAVKGRPIPLFVEKILEPGEGLPPDWPVAGTTGYEFISSVAGLMTDPDQETAITKAYEAFTGQAFAYASDVRAAKQEILSHNLARELAVLTRMLRDLAAEDLSGRDFGADTLRRALVDLAASMPVYRTYIDPDGISDGDRATLAGALEAARAQSNLEDPAVFDFLERVMLQDLAEATVTALTRRFITRWQQTTGPVMAKAVEDTAFYRFNRLIALNEVGGNPMVFGTGTDRFHKAMTDRLAGQPHGLTATATHDTKRGEDARARLYSVSEMGALWGTAVQRWSSQNDDLHVSVGGRRLPDPNAEWLFYQALLGTLPPRLDPGSEPEAWSDLADRMVSFMLKAAREAKIETSWTAQDQSYEDAISRFVRGALDPTNSRTFLDDFLAVCIPLLVAGAVNALSQTVLKVTAPGTPDIYQGTEHWDLSLVDPDNRRTPD